MKREGTLLIYVGLMCAVEAEEVLYEDFFIS